MSRHARLTTISIGSALKESLNRTYRIIDFKNDLLAGLTVGIIAIPLAMALAIASGVSPQYGLYTAMIAGILIPLTGGSRFSVSGPTAAFVVILYPISQKYGLSGLLIATWLAGGMLILMSLARLGRLIEYIPQPVTLGFTAGIAVVIATLQIKDFFGLSIATMPEHYFSKLSAIFEQLPTFSKEEFSTASVTLLILIAWRHLKIAVPAYLPAVLGGVFVSLLWGNHEIATIGSRFSFILPDGTTGFGIPPQLPNRGPVEEPTNLTSFA